MDSASLLTFTSVAVSIGGFVLSVICVVCGAIWTVARISSTTERLAVTINNLSEKVNDLKRTLETVDEKHDGTVQRLTRLEAQVGLSSRESENPDC